MPTKVQCPACGKNLTAPDGLAGRRVKCPKCGQQFALNPATASAQSKVTPASSPGRPLAPPVVAGNVGRGATKIAGRKRLIPIAIGAAAVVILIAAGTIFAIRGGVNADEAIARAATAPPTTNSAESRAQQAREGQKSAEAVPPSEQVEVTDETAGVESTPTDRAESDTRTTQHDSFARLLADIRARGETEPRGLKGAFFPLGVLLKSMEHLADEDASTDYFSSKTYSTWLNERVLLERYGQPAETSEDSIQDINEFQITHKSSKMLRYGWLRILVTPEGEIWAIKFVTKERTQYQQQHPNLQDSSPAESASQREVSATATTTSTSPVGNDKPNDVRTKEPISYYGAQAFLLEEDGDVLVGIAETRAPLKFKRGQEFTLWFAPKDYLLKLVVEAAKLQGNPGTFAERLMVSTTMTQKLAKHGIQPSELVIHEPEGVSVTASSEEQMPTLASRFLLGIAISKECKIGDMSFEVIVPQKGALGSAGRLSITIPLTIE